MVSLTQLAIYAGILTIGFILTIRHYENDVARERRRADRAEAKVNRLLDELDEAVETIDDLVTTAIDRHPARRTRPSFAVITGGAS